MTEKDRSVDAFVIGMASRTTRRMIILWHVASVGRKSTISLLENIR